MQTARIAPRKSCRCAPPDFQQMTSITQEPAATDSNAVAARGCNITVFSHACQHRGEICTGVTSQRQRMPEAAVDLNENRRLRPFLPEFHHSHPMPAQGT